MGHAIQPGNQNMPLLVLPPPVNPIVQNNNQNFLNAPLPGGQPLVPFEGDDDLIEQQPQQPQQQPPRRRIPNYRKSTVSSRAKRRKQGGKRRKRKTRRKKRKSRRKTRKKRRRKSRKKRKTRRRKKGGRLEKHKELGIQINEILKKIKTLEEYNEYNDYGADIRLNTEDIGIIKSYINYKLNNTTTLGKRPLDIWERHLNSIYNRRHGPLSMIERAILRDANMD